MWKEPLRLVGEFERLGVCSVDKNQTTAIREELNLPLDKL